MTFPEYRKKQVKNMRNIYIWIIITFTNVGESNEEPVDDLLPINIKQRFYLFRVDKK